MFHRSRGREVLSITPEQGLVVVHAQVGQYILMDCV